MLQIYKNIPLYRDVKKIYHSVTLQMYLPWIIMTMVLEEVNFSEVLIYLILWPWLRARI